MRHDFPATTESRFRGNPPERSLEFAVSILNLVDDLPQGPKGLIVGRQLLRSGTSIGANLHEAGQSLTEADFAHKCGIARKEASETCYWLRLCERTGLLRGNHLGAAIDEADQLARILSSIIKKTQGKRQLNQ